MKKYFVLLFVSLFFLAAGCRSAVYTAPFVPRLSASAGVLTINLFTNASYLNHNASGSLELTDSLGDAGFTAYIVSVSLATRTTNAGANQVNITLSADTQNAEFYKKVRQADAKVGSKATVKFNSLLTTANYAAISALTNAAAYSLLKTTYGLSVAAENGNTSFVLDDYAGLTGGAPVVTVGNTP